ncbi:MAG: aldo/keto reductase [Bacteroides sp.]|nr:aldo/keto reductase [Bacteroides sp.]
MKRNISRREFVQTGALAATAVSVLPMSSCSTNDSPYDARGLPTVSLGKTGVRVPRLGFGCGSRWMGVASDDKALELLEYALQHGLYYWDTAASYGNDILSSEERIGKILKNHRENVFLVSKTGERDGEKAKRSIEKSLSRLQSDHIDLLHVHSITSVEDAEQLGEKGKVLEVLEQYKKEGIIGHIGFTGHASAEGMKRAAELYDFDAMMLALNHQLSDGSQEFEENPASFAFQKGIGVIAMKVIRPRESIEGLDPGDLVNYALSLNQFHMINVGIDNMEVLKTNIQLLKDFEVLDEQKMKEIRLALSPFYQGKNLAWMKPSYKDGWESGLHQA